MGHQVIFAAYLGGLRLIQRIGLYPKYCKLYFLQTLLLRTQKIMNLNRLVVLGVTSLLVSVAPISSAIAEQSSTQPVLQSSAVEQTVGQTTVAESQTVAQFSGTFVAGEAPTTGAARIVTEGGHRYLELDAAFSTSDQGPDLHVLLDTPSQPPQTYANLGSALNLGGLHSSSGTQRYPIPDAINLQNYGSVVIWCRMANATFGYAPLRPATSALR